MLVPKPYLWFGIQTFCSGYFHSLLLSAFILLAWRLGVAVARGKAAKGRFVFLCIYLYLVLRRYILDCMILTSSHESLVTADQILRVMLHEMLRPWL